MTDLRERLVGDPVAVRAAWDRLMRLVAEGNIDAIRLVLGYAWGAVPQAAKVEAAGEVTIRVVYDD